MIRLSSPTLGGYHDVPCAGEGPSGCATPVPSVDPADASDARPLQVGSLAIPIDHVGRYEVPVGSAALPNRILTDASFALRDDAPMDLLVEDDGIYLAIVPDEPGAEPLWNIHETGWAPGVLDVDASLVFEVLWFQPGAVIEVRDLVVR